jgi:hypothetical protein
MSQHVALADAPDPTDLHAWETKPILDWSPAFMFVVTAAAVPRSASDCGRYYFSHTFSHGWSPGQTPGYAKKTDADLRVRM